MGGFGSGRSAGRLTTEDGLTLDLNKLMRDRLFRPGCGWRGSLIWTNTHTGERVASMGYESYLGESDGRVRLHYTTTRWNGEKHASDYWIYLVTTEQPFGGRRWWFLCPRTNRRVAKLYLPNGALTFGARQSYRLAYPSQRETAYDRALRRAFKLRGRLTADGGIGDCVLKPKWMRLKTFEREMAKIDAAEDVVDSHLWSLIGRLERRVARGRGSRSTA